MAAIYLICPRLFQVRDLKDQIHVSILQINGPIELVADTDIKKGETGNGGRFGDVDGRFRLLVQEDIVVLAGAEEEDVKAVAAAGADFHAVQISGRLRVDIEIDAVQEVLGVDSHGCDDDAGRIRVVIVAEAEETRRRVYREDLDSVEVELIFEGAGIEKEGEGQGSGSALNSQALRCAPYRACVGVGSRRRVQGQLEFGGERARIIEAWTECEIVFDPALSEGELIPADVYGIDEAGDAAIH